MALPEFRQVIVRLTAFDGHNAPAMHHRHARIS
jgi:hypothetical protein